MRGLLTRVVIPVGIIAGVAALAQPDGPTHTAAPAPSPAELAAGYATEHGLTGCVDPSRAFDEGKDVVLTVEVDEVMVPTTPTIVPVSLDEALESGKHSRHNITACNEKENT